MVTILFIIMHNFVSYIRNHIILNLSSLFHKIWKYDSDLQLVTFMKAEITEKSHAMGVSNLLEIINVYKKAYKGCVGLLLNWECRLTTSLSCSMTTSIIWQNKKMEITFRIFLIYTYSKPQTFLVNQFLSWYQEHSVRMLISLSCFFSARKNIFYNR